MIPESLLFIRTGVFITIWICCLIPAFFYSWIFYLADPYEREPAFLLGKVFAVGALVLPFIAYSVNTRGLVEVLRSTNNVGFSQLILGSVIAPWVEELLKISTLCLVAVFSRKHFDSVLDGIVYAAVISFGFAASENAVYLFRATQEGGFEALLYVAQLRIVLGWANHAIFTSFAGASIAYARLHKEWRPFILVGIAASIATHSTHNTLASMSYENMLNIVLMFDFFAGSILAVIIYWGMKTESKWIFRELTPYVDNGLITRRQQDIAASFILRQKAKLIAVNPHLVHEFYALLTDLAHKKNQEITAGENHSSEIAAMQSRILEIRKYVES